MSELQLNNTIVYQWNEEALHNPNVRFIINQGGRGSSKTYSILTLLLVYCLSNKNKTVSIVRKSLASLKGSAMEDFFQILKSHDLYNTNQHHLTENTYTFTNGSRVRFIGADDSEKLKGKKNDLLYINEANQISSEDFFQLNLRCEGKIFLDYNPSDNYSWVYDLIGNDRSTLIKSTYLNNPFLSPAIVSQIEALSFADPDYYRIYGLGEQANTKETIYTHYTTGTFISGDTMYTALDPGFTHKSAVVQVSFVSGTCYARELLYVSNNTNNDLISKLHYLPLQNRELIVDAARPDLIEEVRRSGLKAKGASKAVQAGILAVKSYPLVIDPNSKNLLKEFRSYKWQTDILDHPTDKPVKENDDAVDALRYAVYEHYLKTNRRTTASHLDWLSIDI